MNARRLSIVVDFSVASHERSPITMSSKNIREFMYLYLSFKKVEKNRGISPFNDLQVGYSKLWNVKITMLGLQMFLQQVEIGRMAKCYSYYYRIIVRQDNEYCNLIILFCNRQIDLLPSIQ